MKYLVGLIVFSGIGSFLITDTLDFYQDWRRGDRSSKLLSAFLRLLVLAGLTSVGYGVASETFRQPNDRIVFLVLGVIGACLAHLAARKLKR